MAKAGYFVETGAAVALSASTAKTVLFAMAPSQFGIELKKFSIGFDGVTASAVPVYVEICKLSGASNSTAGTGNTSATSAIVQAYGRSVTTGFTAGYNCTSEPTVLTKVRSFLLSPNSATLMYDFPLGDCPDNDVSTGFAIRCTAPAGVNVRADMVIERV